MVEEVRVYVDYIVNDNIDFWEDYKKQSEYEAMCQNKIMDFLGKNLFHLWY
jgi:hypothetical protein